MKIFHGRLVVSGTVTAPALVTHQGFNLFAAYQNSFTLGSGIAVCTNRGNPELLHKNISGKALCVPQIVGSTAGGMLLYCACAQKSNPACLLLSGKVDSVTAGGAILADQWLDGITMPVIDCLGDEFLDYVKNGMLISIHQDGSVTVQ